MRNKNPPDSLSQLLPLTIGLWAGYLLALFLIDLSFYVHPIFPPRYYLLNGLAALTAVALWRWPHTRSDPLRLPLIIGLLSLTPIITAQAATFNLPPNPASSPEGVLLRIMPLLLMPLILTAWQYGWRAVLLYCGGTAVFTLALYLYFFRPGRASLLPPITVLIIQTISFLVVGYFISSLMARLQAQQDSLAQANRQLADYAAALEELTISRERNRLARELHDTLAHTLSALSVQLETVKAYWEVDSAAAQGMLDSALTATRSGLQETRRALKSLRASPLDDLGLLLAVRQLAEETAVRANLRLILTLPETLPPLATAVEQCLYRVAQEASANVAHHANARTLTVQLQTDPALTLLISDDGQGFDPQQAVAAGHYGLSGMRERAQLVGGELEVRSEVGRGTAVRLHLPTKRARAQARE